MKSITSQALEFFVIVFHVIDNSSDVYEVNNEPGITDFFSWDNLTTVQIYMKSITSLALQFFVIVYHVINNSSDAYEINN